MTLSVVPTSKISRLNSSMSRSDVANLAVVPSFDMTRLECDGSLVKRGGERECPALPTQPTHKTSSLRSFLRSFAYGARVPLSPDDDESLVHRT